MRKLRSSLVALAALALTASVGAASIGTLTVDGGTPIAIDSFVVDANGTVAITVTTTDTGGGGGPTTYTVTTGKSPAAGGTISPTSQLVNAGSTAVFTVTPNSGYQIKNIQGTCGGARSGSTYTTNPVNGNCNVWVNFELVPGGDGGLGDCGTTPANVEVAAAFDIYNGGSTTTHNLNDQIKSFPFTTNGSTTARARTVVPISYLYACAASTISVSA